jgi:Leucine-rich repeat (LRR) protein
MVTSLSIDPIDGNSSVTSIDCGTSSPILGGTLDVSAFENLKELKCVGNNITEITGGIGNPNIEIWLVAQNKLSGSIPDISGMTSLRRFWVTVNEYTGSFPDISGLSNLGVINVGDNNLNGTLPAALGPLGLTSLFRFNVYTNSFTGTFPDCTGMNNLGYVSATANNLTDFTGGVEPSLYRFTADFNNLTETAVDNILQAFVDANRTTNMSIAVINLGGGGNAPPSAAGIANKNTLIGRGWSITTN